MPAALQFPFFSFPLETVRRLIIKKRWGKPQANQWSYMHTYYHALSYLEPCKKKPRGSGDFSTEDQKNPFILYN